MKVILKLKEMWPFKVYFPPIFSNTVAFLKCLNFSRVPPHILGYSLTLQMDLLWQFFVRYLEISSNVISAAQS